MSPAGPLPSPLPLLTLPSLSSLSSLSPPSPPSPLPLLTPLDQHIKHSQSTVNGLQLWFGYEVIAEVLQCPQVLYPQTIRQLQIRGGGCHSTVTLEKTNLMCMHHCFCTCRQDVRWRGNNHTIYECPCAFKPVQIGISPTESLNRSISHPLKKFPKFKLLPEFWATGHFSWVCSI